MDARAWMQAAESGDTEAVRILLAKGCDVNLSTDRGETALMRAAANGHVNAVKVLLDRGADANAKRADGLTALMRAAFFGHSDVVRTLLERAAEKEAKDRLGMTALDWAASKGHTGIVSLLSFAEPARVGPSPLYPADECDRANTGAEGQVSNSLTMPPHVLEQLSITPPPLSITAPSGLGAVQRTALPPAAGLHRRRPSMIVLVVALSSSAAIYLLPRSVGKPEAAGQNSPLVKEVIDRSTWSAPSPPTNGVSSLDPEMPNQGVPTDNEAKIASPQDGGKPPHETSAGASHLLRPEAARTTKKAEYSPSTEQAILDTALPTHRRSSSLQNSGRRSKVAQSKAGRLAAGKKAALRRRHTSSRRSSRR